MGQHKKLFPPIPLDNRQDKNYILMVSPTTGPNRLKFMGIDVETNQIYGNELHDMENPEEWFNKQSFEEVKAAILNCFDTKHDKFSTNYGFREMLAKKLQSKKVPHYLTTPENFLSTLVLIAEGVEPKVGERLLTIGVMLHAFTAVELIRKENAYEIQRKKMVFIKDEKQWQRQKFQILGSTVPDKIVAASMAPTLVNAKFMRILKEKILKTSKNVTIIDDDVTSRIPRLINNLVEKIYDPDFTDYHITPSNHAEIAVSFEPKLSDAKDALIIAKECEPLPLKKSCIIPRTNAYFYVSFLNIDSGKYDVIKKAKFSTDECHRMKIKLIIDENNLPYLYQKEEMIPEIVKMASKLTSNGLYGKDLFLDFDEKEPTLLTALTKSCDQPVIKVSNLLQLLSMPPGAVRKYKKWNFAITKDSKNPLLIEFENSFGKPYKAAPQLLMLLILKQHIKAIKNETGVKPKKLGICLFKEFNENGRKNIETRFGEISKLLDIEFCFVEL
uniref:Uncharacterized protein n=1 Tax=Panagrolaimus davidi TaxID=227884 RepID=A0A914P0A6_9BILA